MILDWLTDKTYPIIYADPPWNWETYSKKGAKKSPTSKYDCMTMEEIGNLPIGRLAGDDCILFCWVTDPLLDKQLAIIKQWGFTYKTVGFTWVKLNKRDLRPFIGLGYYTRSNPEMCLIARKGNPPRPRDRSISQVVMSPIREHSRKPDIIRTNIEKMYAGPYLELFARTQTPNWDCIGNQVTKFDNQGLLIDKPKGIIYNG